MGARRRRAHPDDEAEAQADRREVRRGDRGALLRVAGWRVERLIDEGWELDAHTISHLDLTTMSGAGLRREVTGSRETLRRRFHQPVNFFCYPGGKFDRETIRTVRRAGYRGATTELPGQASRGNMFELHRIRVAGSDGVSGLRQKLRRAGA